MFRYDAFGNRLDSVNAVTTILYSGEQTDQTGLQHLRARYFDPRTGRFTTPDPLAGSFNDPLSLHKYLYVQNNPINATDPSGLSAVWNQFFGYEVEDEIEDVYAREFPGNNVTFGKWGRLSGIFRAKPDILDHDRLKYMEIKPLSPSGLAAAGVQMKLRQDQFFHRGYTPDVTWHVMPTVIYPWCIPTVFFNVAGVLFYTDVIEVAFDYAVYRSLSNVWKLLNSGRLASTLEVALERIGLLTAEDLEMETADVEDGWATSMLTGIL